MAGCRQVVLECAEALGFIARESISRDELEKLIDEGIQPHASLQRFNAGLMKNRESYLEMMDSGNDS